MPETRKQINRYIGGGVAPRALMQISLASAPAILRRFAQQPAGQLGPAELSEPDHAAAKPGAKKRKSHPEVAFCVSRRSMRPEFFGGP